MKDQEVAILHPEQYREMLADYTNLSVVQVIKHRAEQGKSPDTMLFPTMVLVSKVNYNHNCTILAFADSNTDKPKVVYMDNNGEDVAIKVKDLEEFENEFEVLTKENEHKSASVVTVASDAFKS